MPRKTRAEVVEALRELPAREQARVVLEQVKELPPSQAREAIVKGVEALPAEARAEAVAEQVKELEPDQRKEAIAKGVEDLSPEERKELRETVIGLGPPPKEYVGPLWMTVVISFAILLVGSASAVFALVLLDKEPGPLIPFVTAALGVLAGLLAPSPATRS